MAKTKRKNSKQVGFAVIFTVLAFAVSVVSAITGVYFNDGYEIILGRVSPRTFTAPREIENIVATEKLREQAMDSVEPLFAIEPQIKASIIIKLDTLFNAFSVMRMQHNPIINPASQNDTATEEPDIDTDILPIAMSDAQLDFILSADTKTYNDFVSTIFLITEGELDNGIKEGDGVTKSLSVVRDAFNQTDWDVNAKNLGVLIVSDVLEANFFNDIDLTERKRQDKADEVEPVMYQEGQNIVSAGAIVDEEAYAVLSALGYVQETAFENVFPLIGAICALLVVFTIGTLYIRFFYSDIILSGKSMMLLFTLYVTGVVVSRLLSFAPFPFIPLLLVCLLISLLLDARLAIIMCLCLTVNMVASNGFDIKAFIFFMSNGVFVSILGKYTTERSKTFNIGLLVSFFSVFTIGSIYFLIDKRYSPEMLNMLIYSALSGVLTVIICIGSLPIWEAVFGVITPIKLLELTNPDNELLKRLIIEAPGTYHHSLIVANLAETGAYAIGANPTLARVGGYYHDIGKLKYPQYFVENQIGENPHKFMDPYSSAQVLIGHVSAGLELAEQGKLPPIICEFIEQHHGASLIKYFYITAKNANPDADISEADYRYPFRKPMSREAAVIMLADTVEAAVRSMIPTGKSMPEIEAFVRTLIRDKLNDDQLINSNLTVNDLETLANAFMRVLKGMYHERIPYPKLHTKPE